MHACVRACMHALSRAASQWGEGRTISPRLALASKSASAFLIAESCVFLRMNSFQNSRWLQVAGVRGEALSRESAG